MLHHLSARVTIAFGVVIVIVFQWDGLCQDVVVFYQSVSAMV